jgi:hypothetical protein
MIVSWALKAMKKPLSEIVDGHKEGNPPNTSLWREGVPQLVRRLSEKEYWKALLECPVLTRD